MVQKQQKKKLTMKEQKFVTAYIENGGNGTKAALEAYDVGSENAAAHLASKNLRKPAIEEILKAEMERQGITLERVISPVAKGLVDDDIKVQLSAHDRAVKLLGLTEKKDNPSINFNISQANLGMEFVNEQDS